MDEKYQDIHILNLKTRDEKIIRMVRIIHISFGTNEIHILYCVNEIYKDIYFKKRWNQLIID